ncbi:hypothetical protein PILCRDRAFT_369587 [Piloderma croceum F 1598]|uniref:Uncharacterized protein n=1 Tax=Piloderma croceum (strain F 1598) TaxID=765440 RepID=A0A0C3FYU7_PILCF|nr:hypothetical protein PILCRDRAFT_369587 [Piloderma croceum F 1598]
MSLKIDFWFVARILANQHVVDCAKCTNESTPWLVWVDDAPENNEREVELARAQGIEVFQFYSTASAKAWIVANEAELRLKEESRLLRFITDNTRWENDNDDNPTQKDFLNLAAGEQILRFLRGRQYRSPVLVYCCFSIKLTRYVLGYERAGSTTWMGLCLAFIEALGRGEVDDDGWEGYQAEARVFGGFESGSGSGSRPSSASSVSSTRLRRFGDEATTNLLFGVGSGGAVRATSIPPSRVHEMRHAVRYIRRNWWNYPIFLHDLCSSLLDAVGPSLLSEVFHSRREWVDGEEEPTVTDRSVQSYGLIRLYTTEIGYNRLVEILTDVFRLDDDITQTPTNGIRFLSSIFLKELLSIELYNHRNVRAFTGIVYHGLCLSPVCLGDIRSLVGRDTVMERVWDMPWSVLSCTENVADALNYVQRDAAATASRRAVLWRIHVAEMGEELLGVYRARFPSAMIGSFGATSIKDLSLHSQENEVVLLGCNCQVVRMETIHMRVGGTMDVIDGVVLNTSIDHPSTTELGEEEEMAARELFDWVCAIERARVCSRLAEGYGLEEDASAYRAYYQEEYLKL